MSVNVKVGNQWIVEEYDPANFHDKVVASFSTYDEAFSFYKEKSEKEPNAQLSMRRVDRQLLQE